MLQFILQNFFIVKKIYWKDLNEEKEANNGRF